MRSRHLGQICLAAAVLLAGAGAAQAQTAAGGAEAGKLKVTVEYKGQSGTVDKDHKIWIWLCDSPDITTDTMPIATGWLTENKGTYTFASLPKKVYIAAAFDNKGGYDGTAAPPASGTPVTVLGAKQFGAPATAVMTGADDATVTVTFDDSVRIP